MPVRCLPRWAAYGVPGAVRFAAVDLSVVFYGPGRSQGAVWIIFCVGPVRFTT